jgi:2-(1,2-epoxy-1,2-dihydrophenyl)acetyl-CoA isomerase
MAANGARHAMTATDPVTMSIWDGVASLTLARPKTRNAISPDIARSLDEKAAFCESSDQVRCVLLTGSGRFFSVGGDIDLFAKAGDDAQAQILALARQFHRAVHRLATMPKPFITAINGPAAGAGMSLAILGDIVLAAETAHFTAAYSAVGLTPDGGLSWTLPRLVGLRRAQDLILTNRRVDAREAVSIGLVTRTVPEDELAEAAFRQASQFATGPVAALGTCRAFLATSHTATFAEQLDAEAQSIAAACAGAEGREGVAAFLEKRPADFLGGKSHT